METGDQLQIVIMRPFEKRSRRLHGLDLGDERVATLLGRFEGGGLPFTNFLFLPISFEMDLSSLTEEGDDAGGSNLGGLAHNGIHIAAFGESLAERNFKWKRGHLLCETHFQHGGIFAICSQFADPFTAMSIKGDNGIAEMSTIDGD